MKFACFPILNLNSHCCPEFCFVLLLRATRVSVCVGQRGLCPRSQRETGHLEQHHEEAKVLRGLGFPRAGLTRLLVSSSPAKALVPGQGPRATAKPVCRAPSAHCRSGLDTLQSWSANWHGGSISFLVALHMINWTIGQLGLGEAQGPGHGSTGHEQGQGSLCQAGEQNFPEVGVASFVLFAQFSADFERKKVLPPLRQMAAAASFSVSHFAEAYGCMCKNSSDAGWIVRFFFTSREGGSESEECVLNDGEIERVYALTLDERVKLGHGRHAAGDL